MNIAAIFSAVIGVINLIPTVQGWVESFVAYYVEKQRAQMRAENLAAIRKAINEHDQRGIEEALGNPNAGEPSGIGGVEFRTGIVGVSDPARSAVDGVVK